MNSDKKTKQFQRWFIFWFVLFLFIFSSLPAAALGKREEGVLLGIGGLLLLDAVTENNRTGVYRGETVPTERFPRFRCSGDAITCSYAKGVYDREKEEWYDEQYRDTDAGDTENVMSKMGQFVMECQQIAMQSESVAEVKAECKKTFADRGLVEYTDTAVKYYGQLDGDPAGSIYEDIPF